eukprot:CAMPEP_0182472634 /NCGR_PEP_ID=MMETSP1319-20130603/22528_1 /TAXON_ID=172717 /ORGANISM="Bolidomonas pacifica, Strain RCC208" /LENGTH=265 /DNA_ID=CAMNT_0024673351 /DNA_START=285 /DNA_END=1079 /DNA_ORIENTATION=+
MNPHNYKNNNNLHPTAHTLCSLPPNNNNNNNNNINNSYDSYDSYDYYKTDTDKSLEPYQTQLIKLTNMSIRNPLSHNVVHNQQCYTLTFLPTALAPTAVLYITFNNINTSPPLPLNSLQNLHESLLPTLPCLPLSTADPTVKTKSYDPASVLEAFKAALLAATALPTVNLHPEDSGVLASMNALTLRLSAGRDLASETSFGGGSFSALLSEASPPPENWPEADLDAAALSGTCPDLPTTNGGVPATKLTTLGPPPVPASPPSPPP